LNGEFIAGVNIRRDQDGFLYADVMKNGFYDEEEDEKMEKSNFPAPFRKLNAKKS
jgi:hypothetical protein